MSPCAANLAAICCFFGRDSKLFVHLRVWVVGIDPDLHVDGDTRLGKCWMIRDRLNGLSGSWDIRVRGGIDQEQQ